MPLFGAGTLIEEQMARMQRYYSQLAEELVGVHNSIQTGEVSAIGAGNTVFVFTWQTPWPVPPTYKVFASFTWQTTYIFARSADGLSVTITTALPSAASSTMLILGVA